MSCNYEHCKQGRNCNGSCKPSGIGMYDIVCVGLTVALIVLAVIFV